MDYYEEFGVPRTAGPEEVRRSYKRLVRLLHPDRCRDPEVKRLADIQMKRLNGMLAALTDPVRRAEYDRVLLEPPASAPHQRPGQSQPPPWFWAAMALVIIAAILLLPHHPAASPTIASFAGPASGQPSLEAAGGSAPVRSVRTVRSRTRAPAVDSKPRVIAEYIPESLSIPEPIPEPPLVALNLTGFTFKPAPPEHAERADWAGDWFYVAGVRNGDASLYPPEYIQLRITQDGPSLHGRYRARYVIRDRAISPSVNFQFDGAPDSEGVLAWTGPGGAHGQVKLELVSGGMLLVSWSADQLGKELGLISGKAVLIRKLE